MKGKEFYLAEAERVRSQAETVPDKTARSMLHTIADTYLQLAEMAGRRKRPEK